MSENLKVVELKQTKTFRGDFDLLYNKLKNREYFAYTRYSDGSLYVLQNKKLVLAADHFQIGDKVTANTYHPEDHKLFDPEIHQFYRERLIESYKFKKHNYYVGLSCKCCVGEADNKWMRDLYFEKSHPDNEEYSEEFLTWANLWVNGNYPLFHKQMIQEFKNHKVVYIVNEMADLSVLKSGGIDIVKDFRVGHNCFVNNYGLIEEVKNWIKENDIKDHLFLFSAADLSNMMIHQLYSDFDKNTYINIGTCLNPWLGPQIKGRRGYLTGNNPKICIW